MNPFLVITVFILLSFFPCLSIAEDFSKLSVEELTQMRSQMAEMNSDERKVYSTEMRRRMGSTSTEEREILRNSLDKGAGAKKYGSGFGSRDGGSRKGESRGSTPRDGSGKRKGKS